MKRKNDIRADAGDYVADIVVQTAADGRNANYHGHADHYAQHGQPRAQLIAANRIRRHVDDLAELVFANHEESNDLDTFAIGQFENPDSLGI